MRPLRCQNEKCSKPLDRSNFRLLEGADVGNNGFLFIFCVTCADKHLSMSKVVGAKDAAVGFIISRCDL